MKLPAASLVAPRASVSRVHRPPSRTGTWLAALLAVLLLINAALYYKLYYTDRSGYSFDLDDLQNRWVPDIFIASITSPHVKIKM